MGTVVEGEHSDSELMTRARAGSAAAFAALLHRHGPAVRASVASDRDPTAATLDTFVDAMRDLPHREPSAPVRPWLLDLASRHSRDAAPIGSLTLPPLDPAEADAIWLELDRRWPDGRVARQVPRWVGWAALVVALVSLAVLVPYLLLTLGNDEESGVTELLAVPYEDEPDAEPDDDVPVIAEDAPVDRLPSFRFPDEPTSRQPQPPPPSPADTTDAEATPDDGPVDDTAGTDDEAAEDDVVGDEPPDPSPDTPDGGSGPVTDGPDAVGDPTPPTADPTGGSPSDPPGQDEGQQASQQAVPTG